MLRVPLTLLAEDGDDDAEILLRAFQRAGLSAPAHVCVDGMQVVSYLKGDPPFSDRSRYPFPDLLVLDVKLPKMSGLEVLRWIRAESSCTGLPVVMFTSFATPDVFKDLYLAGANACLSKPVDFNELQFRLKSLYQFWSWCEFPTQASRA